MVPIHSPPLARNASALIGFGSEASTRQWSPASSENTRSNPAPPYTDPSGPTRSSFTEVLASPEGCHVAPSSSELYTPPWVPASRRPEGIRTSVFVGRAASVVHVAPSSPDRSILLPIA